MTLSSSRRQENDTSSIFVSQKSRILPTNLTLFPHNQHFLPKHLPLSKNLYSFVTHTAGLHSLNATLPFHLTCCHEPIFRSPRLPLHLHHPPLRPRCRTRRCIQTWQCMAERASRAHHAGGDDPGLWKAFGVAFGGD